MLVEKRRDLEVDEEVVEALSYFSGLVFMNNVANLIKDDQLELSLHLGNSQIFVHSVTSRQQK